MKHARYIGCASRSPAASMPKSSSLYPLHLWLNRCTFEAEGAEGIELHAEHRAEFAGLHAAATAGVPYVPGKPPEWYNPNPWS